MQAAARVAHPRLLMLQGEEAIIRNDILKDTLKKKIHDVVIRHSNKILKINPVTYTLKGRRLLDQSRDFLQRVFFLSYAYRMAGDTVYAARAEKEMLAVAAFDNWNPDHFLDVAEMITGMAIGYDWLYPYLSKESRLIISKSIIEKGLLPSLENKYIDWLQYDNNWNQVCNTGLLLGALAIYELDEQLANTVINRSIRSIKKYMKHYAPSGAYPEGYCYWEYGTSFNVLMISCLEKVYSSDFGLTSIDGFSNSANFMLHMVGPFGYPFNYSDCAPSFPEKYLSPTLFWYAGKFRNCSYLYNQKNILRRENITITTRERLLPAALIWTQEQSINTDCVPNETYWIGDGKTPVALMRTSWKDTNAIFLGLKGGTPAVSHGHMDIGSFVLDALGERWVIDMNILPYNEVEQYVSDLWDMSQYSGRWKLIRYNNMGHNTITIDSLYQKVNGYSRIISGNNSSNKMTAVVHMIDAYDVSIKNLMRTAAILNKSYVVIEDKIQTSKKKIAIQWRVLTPAAVQVIKPNLAKLTLHNKSMLVKLKSRQNITFQVQDVVPSLSFETQVVGLKLLFYESHLSPRKKIINKVIFIPESNTKYLKYTRKNI